MLAKYLILPLAILVNCTPVWAQSTATVQPPTRVVGTGFLHENTGTSVLQVEFEQLKIRLAELEEDLASRPLAVRPPFEIEESDDTSTDLESRISKVEESVEQQAGDLEDLDATLPNLVFNSHKSPKMSLFGRIHLDYWGFAKADESLFPLENGNPQDRIAFRRLRIGVKGDLNDNVFYKYEGEFADGVDPSYRDAYIGIKDLPRLHTVIIGNQKRPYGLDHLNSSRYNVFLERPFVVEAFNEDSRRLGVSSNGYSKDQAWNWRFGVWNERLTQKLSGYIGDHYQMEMAGRIAATPWYDETSGGRGYAHFGLSGSVGYPDGLGGIRNAARYRTRPEARSSFRWLNTGQIAGADTNMLLGLESVINVGALQFTGEYLRTNVDRLDSFGNDLEFDGGYVQAAYFLTGEYMPWNRKMGTLARVKPLENFFLIKDCDSETQRGLGAWQIAARYSWGDFTDEDIIGGEAESLTLGLNWYWNPYARLQFNWLIGNIDRFPEGGGDYSILGTRLMVDF